MAKRVFQAVNYTPTANADASAMPNSTYQGLRGATGTQKVDVLEVMISGFAGASAPTILQLARSTVLATTPSGLAAPNSDGPEDPASAALTSPVITFTTATTGPQRSAATTDARLQLGLNAFGGIIRWNAAPTQQWVVTGNTTPGGESFLSAFTGGTVGAISSHILYEPY